MGAVLATIAATSTSDGPDAPGKGAVIATIAAASTSDGPDAPGKESAALSLRCDGNRKRLPCGGFGAEGDFRCDWLQDEGTVRA